MGNCKYCGKEINGWNAGESDLLCKKCGAKLFWMERRRLENIRARKLLKRYKKLA